MSALISRRRAEGLVEVPQGLEFVFDVVSRFHDEIRNLIRHNSYAFPSTLAGACGICSYYSWRVLRITHPGFVSLVCGKVNHSGHAWLETENYIIDGTVRQFFSNEKDVTIFSRYAAEQRKYTPYYKDFEVVRDFKLWISDFQPRCFSKELNPVIYELIDEFQTNRGNK